MCIVDKEHKSRGRLWREKREDASTKRTRRKAWMENSAWKTLSWNFPRAMSLFRESEIDEHLFELSGLPDAHCYIGKAGDTSKSKWDMIQIEIQERLRWESVKLLWDSHPPRNVIIVISPLVFSVWNWKLIKFLAWYIVASMGVREREKLVMHESDFDASSATYDIQFIKRDDEINE